MARASARFCRSPRGHLWRPAAQSPPVRSRACPRKCSPGGRERFRGWSTKPSDGTEDPMTIGRPARLRAPIETTQSRKGKATLVRKPECRPFHLYLALQALSHPPCDGSFDPQRRFRARATQRFADEGGPCMRILPSGPVESSIGSTLASWKQPFSLRARSATARTTTADLFTWCSPRRGWFTSRADSDGPGARKRTANAWRRPAQADTVPEANRAASIARLPL